MGEVWTHPDLASQEAGILILFLGWAVLSLILTAMARR